MNIFLYGPIKLSIIIIIFVTVFQIFLETVYKMNDHSFAQFYKKHFPYFLSFAIEFVENEEDANDVVQEVFMACWEKKIDFEDTIHAKAYIYRAVHNNCINLLRKSKRIQSINEKKHDIYTEEFLEEQIIKEEIAIQVQEKLACLTPQEQNVIRLSLKGCSVKEVAEKIGISVNTVKVYKKRAYSQLRVELKSLKKLLSLVIL